MNYFTINIGYRFYRLSLLYQKRLNRTKKDYTLTRPSTYVVNKPVIKPVSTTAPIIPATAPVIPAPTPAPVIPASASAPIEPAPAPAVSPPKRMLVNSPLQSRHATPQRKSTPKRQTSPSLMQSTPTLQVIEKSRQSAPIRSRQETPITVRQQTPLSTRKVTPIRSISPSLMQTSYPPTPTPNAYGKSPISDKSNISSISDPMQNIPVPPQKIDDKLASDKLAREKLARDKIEREKKTDERKPGESEENHKKRVKKNESRRIKSAQAKQNKDAMNAEFKEMIDQDERNKLYDTNKRIANLGLIPSQIKKTVQTVKKVIN